MIQSGGFYNAEVHVFPSINDYSVYYIYKIPFSQLFFEKNSNDFISGLTVNIEVKDSVDNVITRGFDEKNISVQEFDITNSQSAYLQGFITVKLKEGRYKIFTVISDKTSKRERRIPPQDIFISSSEKILEPIIIDSGKVSCNNYEAYILTNNSLSVPFNLPENILAIPVSDSSIKSLSINVARGDTSFYQSLTPSKSITLDGAINLCDKSLVIQNNVDDSSKIKYFFFNNFSSKLTEGPIKIEVIPDSDLTKEKVFNLNVIWIGKPFSLHDPEAAIKYLKIIESEKTVSELLDESNDLEALNNYWKQFDPTPEINYNELMDEFYQRVDYCEDSFKPIDGKSGANSDRGKIYIKFGAPDRIERDTNNDGKVVESWFYDNPTKSFIFIDNDGTGKYLLVNGK